ncbi:prenyltransferase/squalene oxidase repeat-containing protein [Streptomyces sp. DT2A-34]|uniref:prenyltransferase/squalene oxidase repeat-containing protein n=1 Tax=Streptomyces sp. DT2A-34 TaxID=3051182 RepID=UPI00265BAF5A|nr:prenyltransferase/squalene oxidase repeat-containing protein [Streptomyces sp. DT2A-34]MDO0917536.1 prenyltransferase/squalene oxidase repeat-containing protein [Streptomyces sp. DT2A-34]
MTTIDTHAPARLQAARRRLYDHLCERVESDGAIRERCGSRILETALLLDLLRKEHTESGTQQALLAFLQQARPSGFLDTAFVNASLGQPVAGEELRSGLDGFRHFTGVRKRILLETLLATLGAVPFRDCVDPGDVRQQEQAVWTDLTLGAVRILHATHRGRHFPGLEEDRRRLTDSLSSFTAGAAWQGNVLAHLIALHALRTFQSGGKLLRDGMRALVGTVNPDGGAPFIAGQEVWVTALAGTALAGAGDPAAVVPRMASYIADRQLADGGWGYDETTTQSDVDDTSRCAVLLRLADPDTHRTRLTRADDYLLNLADPTGGWPTYVRGHDPEPDLTAGAVIALAADPHSHSKILERGVGFLLEAQRHDGTWQCSWARSQSSVITHAVQALDASATHVSPTLRAHIRSAVTAAARRLTQTQNPDGGWGHKEGAASDALSTAHAIPVIVRHASPTVADRALAHLLEHQDADGGFTAPPDQVGPRPLPYNFPVLAGIHALTTLNAAGESYQNRQRQEAAVAR